MSVVTNECGIVCSTTSMFLHLRPPCDLNYTVVSLGHALTNSFSLLASGISNAAQYFPIAISSGSCARDRSNLHTDKERFSTYSKIEFRGKI